jgi:hypothetical protein
MKISEEKAEDGFLIEITEEDMKVLRINVSQWITQNEELDTPMSIVRVIRAIYENHYWMYNKPQYYSESTKEFLKELYNIK